MQGWHKLLEHIVIKTDTRLTKKYNLQYIKSIHFVQSLPKIVQCSNKCVFDISEKNVSLYTLRKLIWVSIPMGHVYKGVMNSMIKSGIQ